MSTSSLQKDFERLSKKQRTARSSRNAKLDFLLQQLEKAKSELEAQDEPMEGAGHTKEELAQIAQESQTVVMNLVASVKPAETAESLAAENKDLCTAITKFGKAVDKAMPPDLERAIKPVVIEGKLLNQVIVEHLVRSGRVDLARSLAKEAELVLPDATVAPYQAIFDIVDAIPRRNLSPALQWVQEHEDELASRNSPLPFRLARMHFLQLVEQGRVDEAVAYARGAFPRHAGGHLSEILRLMGTLAFAHRLEASPYSAFFDPEEWEALGSLFRAESCEVLGLGHDLPLSVSVGAGVRALPALLKFATVMQAKMGDWHGRASLAVEVDLGPDCRFHSVFVCPVSREQASKDNRPMMMQCGHVLCEQSVRKLSRGGGRFKCPYCPAEVSLSTSMRLYI
mmetsp:Transcript_50502/g.100820  ORF Transcript_50502/g.100820 Transcript_50502/m.100820 type:complete len:397 (+) Transcript_50502:146-1336(+)